MQPDAFVENGVPIPFAEAVTSGLSVGTPGTPLTWQRALDEWGSLSLLQALRGAIVVAARGFVVDETFRQQTLDNLDRFDDFTLDARSCSSRRVTHRRSARYSATATWPAPTCSLALAVSTGCMRAASAATSSGPRSSHRSSRARIASSVLAYSSDPTSPPTTHRSASRRSSTTAGSTSTAWRRPRAAARRSARR